MRFLLIGLDGPAPGTRHPRSHAGADGAAEAGARCWPAIPPPSPTETYVNLPTLVTGARPSGHGMVANFFLDPRVDARERFEGYDITKIEKATAAYDGRAVHDHRPWARFWRPTAGG